MYRRTNYGRLRCFICQKTDGTAEGMKQHIVDKHGITPSQLIITTGPRFARVDLQAPWSYEGMGATLAATPKPDPAVSRFMT